MRRRDVHEDLHLVTCVLERKLIMNSGATAGYLYLGLLFIVAIFFTKYILKKEITLEMQKKLELICFASILVLAIILTIFWS